MGVMLIGELSRRTGTPVRTIRFYEDRGVLPRPERTASGYRVYSDDAVGRLRFVASSQAAGLKLAEIKSILLVRQAGEAPCEHTKSLLEARRREIDERLRDLRQLRKDVDVLLARSETLDPADCSPEAVCHLIAIE